MISDIRMVQSIFDPLFQYQNTWQYRGVVCQYESVMRVESVISLQEHASKMLSDLHEHQEPILLMEHGMPAAYLVDVADYERTQLRIQLLEGILSGEADIRDGKLFPQSVAKEKMQRWLE